MDWFRELKLALPKFYPATNDSRIVGFLRGSNNTSVWASMASSQNRNQMLILGSDVPTHEMWVHAGVEHRSGEQHVIKLEDLSGWIVLQAGGHPRPYGMLFEIDKDCLDLGFPASLQYWRNNFS